MKILIYVFLFAWVLPLTDAAGALTPAAKVTGPDVLTAQEVVATSDKKAGLVVVFLSAKCPCSNSHINELKALAAEFPEFSFVGVHSNTDEAMETTRAYFKSANLPFPVIQDNGAKLADLYRALKTPHAFVILPDAKTVFRGGVSSSHDFGSAERKYLREALNDIHHHSGVKTPEARTLGCAISRSGNYVW